MNYLPHKVSSVLVFCNGGFGDCLTLVALSDALVRAAPPQALPVTSLQQLLDKLLLVQHYLIARECGPSHQQEPMQDNGVYNTGLARILILLVYKVLTQKYVQRWWKPCGRIIFAPPNLCIKSTPFTTLVEAETMQFVAQHTTVPVPKVHCAFEHKGRVYIVMERIDGQDLSQGWVQRPEDSKARILTELKSMAEQLRSIPARTDWGVASTNGGPIYDQRLPGKSVWGPFKTIQDFHKELRNGIEVENVTENEFAPDLKKLISFHNQPWPNPVFTHGDLSSLNILVRGDKIVGIVDWETAGWLPPYWEYTSAWNVNPQNRFWQEEVDQFLVPLPHELEMENIRRRFFGDF